MAAHFGTKTPRRKRWGAFRLSASAARRGRHGRDAPMRQARRRKGEARLSKPGSRTEQRRYGGGSSLAAVAEVRGLVRDILRRSEIARAHRLTGPAAVLTAEVG